MFSFYVVALTVLVLPLWGLVSLVQNYNIARTTRLPILISPVNPFNPFWILLRSYINPIFSSLPFGLGSFTDYNFLGFAWKDKGHLHALYGGAYIIVTPGQNQLIVGDADACNDIFKHYRQWPKNAAFNEPLNTFGPNVGTAEGDAWQRQRKITAVAFNERNNRLVWEEAIKQTRQMLSSWVLVSKKELGVTSTAEDNYLFALHVLTGAGFGRSYDFDSPLKVPDPGHTMSYREALKGVMGNIFITYAIVKARGLSIFLPASAKKVQRSIDEFKAYMLELVNKERTLYSQGEGTDAANLMSTLVRASENEARASDEKSRGSLTDEEFVGNLFIFNVAGHDTTAGTLTYAIGLLACNPELQDWIKAELTEVFGAGDVREDQYEAVFPRLKRCMAIMVRRTSDSHGRGSLTNLI
jgi:cytochrome P450